MSLISLAERGFVPDSLIRLGIRRLLKKRIRLSNGHVGEFAEELRNAPLAVETDAANQQHYEVPAEFFQYVLGPHLKYSACWFPTPQTPLEEAEEAMLRLTCERAELVDGQRILELGCGWGSLSLWMAANYPRSQITVVSNSGSQREFIEAKAAERGIENLQVITADMREFSPEKQFDRIVSVEMFEHMRNYQLLFERISSWLEPDGKVFAHIFCHRDSPYLFESEGKDNWMGRHFFTGGTMPSEHLFDEFRDDLVVEEQWRVDGIHYWRTCEAWLQQLDRKRAGIEALFRRDLSHRDAQLTVQRWRIFFMACGELFRYRQGDEWFVAHYRFQQADRVEREHVAAARSVAL